MSHYIWVSNIIWRCLIWIGWLVNHFCLDTAVEFIVVVHVVHFQYFFQYITITKLLGPTVTFPGSRAQSGKFGGFGGISDWTVSRIWCCGALNSWSKSSRVVNFYVRVIVTRSVFSWVPTILNRNCNQEMLSETSKSSGPTSEVEFPKNTQMWHMPPRTISAHISK